MKTKVVSIMAACFSVISFCAKPAKATLITIEIAAVVDSLRDGGDYLEGKIKPGDIITGLYTYESTTPDSNPIPQVADYLHRAAPCGISLTVGGFEFKTDPANVDFLVEIINDSTSGGLHDAYGLISYNNLALRNGTLVDSISWWLTDTSASALSSSELPSIAPVLNDWESIYGLRLYGERAGYIIDAHVTFAIPEPATILMLGFGSLLLRKRT
jgi:hypothetical protein